LLIWSFNLNLKDITHALQQYYCTAQKNFLDVKLLSKKGATKTKKLLLEFF